MINNGFQYGFLLALSLTGAKSGFARYDERGNGIDRARQETGSAWFLGDAPISYCVEVGKQFPVDVASVQQTVSQVFVTWQSYFRAKRVNENTPWDFLRLALEFNRKECADPLVRLKIFVGVQNEEIQKYAKKYENPLAFVERTEYDINTGLGRGFVWVAPHQSVVPKKGFPNWTYPKHLHGILLHEIGHIFGTGHVVGTIMADNHLRSLLEDPGELPFEEKRLTSIDHYRELIRCTLECNWDYPLSYAPRPIIDDKNLFDILMGRSPQGRVNVRLIGGSRLVNGLLAKNAHLSFQDDFGSTSFEIKYSEKLAPTSQFRSQEKVVYRVRNSPENAHLMTAFSVDDGEVEFLSIRSELTGKTVRLVEVVGASAAWGFRSFQYQTDDKVIEVLTYDPMLQF